MAAEAMIENDKMRLSLNRMNLKYGGERVASTTPPGSSQSLRGGQADENRRRYEHGHCDEQFGARRASNRHRRALRAEQRTLTAPVPAAERNDAEDEEK